MSQRQSIEWTTVDFLGSIESPFSLYENKQMWTGKNWQPVIHNLTEENTNLKT